MRFSSSPLAGSLVPATVDAAAADRLVTLPFVVLEGLEPTPAAAEEEAALARALRFVPLALAGGGASRRLGSRLSANAVDIGSPSGIGGTGWGTMWIDVDLNDAG